MSATLPVQKEKEQNNKSKLNLNSKEKEQQNNIATAEEHKQRGNEYVASKQYTEAILEYTNAIQLDPGNPIYYSNRSLAFLKTNQLYYANKDAETCIQLDKNWVKGYFRRGEVQAAARQYDVSLLCYGRALQLEPTEPNIKLATKRVADLRNQATLYEQKIPWIGAAIGIGVGVSIVLADQLLTKVPTTKHPLIMGALIIVISLIGYGIARLLTYYSNLQHRKLLEPPLELADAIKEQNGTYRSDDNNDEEHISTTRSRYTKSQAWQRFRKGKSQK